MALVDWTLLTADDLKGRVADNASPREQVEAFMQIGDLVRERRLNGVVLDMDHAIPHLPRDAADFAADLLAETLAHQGLKSFALVDHALENPWWRRVVDKLHDIGVHAGRFDTVRHATAWLTRDLAEDER